VQFEPELVVVFGGGVEPEPDPDPEPDPIELFVELHTTV